MKPKPLFFWRRVCALMIDLSVVYSITIVLQALLWLFTFLAFWPLFVTVLLVYYLFCYLVFNGQTLAKHLTQLTVTTVGNKTIAVKAFLLREVVLKGIIGIVVPFFAIKHIFPLWSVLHTAIVAAITLIISLLFLLIFKRQWWEFFSGTATVRNVRQRTSGTAAFVMIASAIVAAIFVINYPSLLKHENFYKTYAPAYPITKETTAYAQFIKQHAEDPVDYIFDLFKTHDVVVLSERIHSEYSQYELIKRIVSDERFASSVGNLFTECGSISFQDTLSSYLHTTFASEDDLNKATAILQRNSNAVWPLWSNTNLFDLLKTVNKANNRLPNTSKINWYFTDLPVDWRTMSHQKFLHAYTTPQRDSLMAAHIIAPYKNIVSKQQRHKALVIMNTRHGYGLLEKNKKFRFAMEYMGTTAYLMQALPDKVANVFLNSISIRYGPMMTPVQNGKWDRAFTLAGNPNVGFNFLGSPFGKDQFDAAFFTAPDVCYQDVFTGFVFYKPLEEHYQRNGFPYEFDGFEDSILKRASYVSDASVQSYKYQLQFYKQHPSDPVTTDPLVYAYVYNLVTVRGASVLLLVGLLTAFLVLILWRKPKVSHKLVNKSQIT